MAATDPATTNSVSAEQTLGGIAARVPGATAIFRELKLDFCCGGHVALKTAAAEKKLPLDDLISRLDALKPGCAPPAPAAPGELVPHILARFHETHRQELPELVRLAKKVEAVHREHPLVPQGLSEALEETRMELESHMQKEETILFPMMLAGGNTSIAFPISVMRAEHIGHGEQLVRLESLAHGFEPPPEACATWRALYTGLHKLVDDVREHIHLENNVLFPQFADDRDS